MRHEPESGRFYLARYYGEAVEAAGGLPVHLPLIPRADYLASVADRLDGLLLPGSASDVDPLLYGHDPRPGLGPVHPLRDGTDALLLAEVERRRLPLLAICYGLQIWNVVRGGTLVQDIRGEHPQAVQHEQGSPRERRSHRIRLLSDSLISELAGAGAAVVNSHHHQAVDTIGENLRATAWTHDGLIEALEETRPGRWAVGVQWHPELDWAADDFSVRLFRSFVAAAEDFSAARKGHSDTHEVVGHETVA